MCSSLVNICLHFPFTHLSVSLFFFLMLQQISQVLNNFSKWLNTVPNFPSALLISCWPYSCNSPFSCSTMDQLINRCIAIVLNFPLPLFSADFFVSLSLYIPVSWFTVLILQKHLLLYPLKILCTGGKVFEFLGVWTFLYSTFTLHWWFDWCGLWAENYFLWVDS